LRRSQELSEAVLAAGVIEGGVFSVWEGLSLLTVAGDSLLSCAGAVEE